MPALLVEAHFADWLVQCTYLILLYEVVAPSPTIGALERLLLGEIRVLYTDNINTLPTL